MASAWKEQTQIVESDLMLIVCCCSWEEKEDIIKT